MATSTSKSPRRARAAQTPQPAAPAAAIPAAAVAPKPAAARPAERFEGFGALADFGAHVFRVTIPASTSGDIVITEDYGFKGGERGVPPKEVRVVLPRRFWSAISEVVRKDFAARLKAKKLTTSRWSAGENKVDRMLGKELCVLAWAAEHAQSAAECKAIATRWMALKPEERWWLFNQTAAQHGLAEDRDGGWRRALYFALADFGAQGQHARSIRPVEETAPSFSLF